MSIQQTKFPPPLDFQPGRVVGKKEEARVLFYGVNPVTRFSDLLRERFQTPFEQLVAQDIKLFQRFKGKQA